MAECTAETKWPDAPTKMSSAEPPVRPVADQPAPSSPSPVDLSLLQDGRPGEDVRPNQPSVMSPEDIALPPTTGWPPYEDLFVNAPNPKLNMARRPRPDWNEGASDLGASRKRLVNLKSATMWRR